MSPIIAECEMHLTDLSRFNWFIFHRKSRFLYLVPSILFSILAIIFFFLSQFSIGEFMCFCSVKLSLLSIFLLQHAARKMMKANLRLLLPHRVILTKDSVQEFPPVGQQSPYTAVNCPYDKLYGVICTREFYYFRYNLTSICIFPRTMLTPWQEWSLCEKLRLYCGKRFVILPY